MVVCGDMLLVWIHEYSNKKSKVGEWYCRIGTSATTTFNEYLEGVREGISLSVEVVLVRAGDIPGTCDEVSRIRRYLCFCAC